MEYSLPVTPYVFKYLLKTYQPGPYDLRTSHNNEISDALQSLPIRVDPLLIGTRRKYPEIKILVNPDHQLISLMADEVVQALLKRGLFFHYEFKVAMRRYIEAQEQLAISAKLSSKDWNKWQALQTFLRSYGITEEEYSADSAYRQLTRSQQIDEHFFSMQLVQRFGFWSTENKHFKLCTLYIDPNNRWRVRFWCYSRIQQKSVRANYDIPQKLIEQNLGEAHAAIAMKVINRFLLKGFSIR